MRDWDQFGDAYDMPPFFGRPRTYLIASTPRSGSHFLGHILHTSGEWSAPLEYFNKANLEKWRRLLRAKTNQEIFQNLFQRRTHPTGWFGLKAHWRQFSQLATDEQFIGWLALERFVHVYRRDEIAQAVSLVIARQTNAWISFHEKAKEPKYSFADISKAIAYIRTEIAAWNAYFSSRRVEPLVLEYEALIENPDIALEAMRGAFGIPSIRLEKLLTELPERQATPLNEEWKAHYLCDLQRPSSFGACSNSEVA
jgi:trehalose 2-sulfotransferase